MDITVQELSIIVIAVTLLITGIVRRRPHIIRTIPAFEYMKSFVGLSIESNQPMHLSIGSVGLGGESTLLAIASAELAYHMSRRAAIGDVSPVISLSETSALPLGMDTLRRAYEARDLGERYRASAVHWYPTGTRSLAFAAALTAMMSDENVSSNTLAGSFGPELALVMDASMRRKLPVVAASDQLEGQAVAYVMSDELLIGEEIFQSRSYLDGSNMSEAVTMDLLRWLVVLVVVIAFVLSLVGD